MELTQLRVELREETGKGPARRLRQRGMIPGVAYGRDSETVHVYVPATELDRILRASEGGNVIIDLEIPGTKKAANIATIIKDIQRDPVSRKPLNVDFQWVSLEQRITVEVAVEVVGSAPGVVEDGGVVQQQMHTVQVSCLPMEIPDRITANIDGMHIGGALHVRDLDPVNGVEVLAPDDDVLLSVVAPIREEELEVRAEEAELEELVGLEAAEELAAEEAEEAAEAPAEAEEESE